MDATQREINATRDKRAGCSGPDGSHEGARLQHSAVLEFLFYFNSFLSNILIIVYPDLNFQELALLVTSRLMVARFPKGSRLA